VKKFLLKEQHALKVSTAPTYDSLNISPSTIQAVQTASDFFPIIAADYNRGIIYESKKDNKLKSDTM